MPNYKLFTVCCLASVLHAKHEKQARKTPKVNANPSRGPPKFYAKMSYSQKFALWKMMTNIYDKSLSINPPKTGRRTITPTYPGQFKKNIEGQNINMKTGLPDPKWAVIKASDADNKALIAGKFNLDDCMVTGKSEEECKKVKKVLVATDCQALEIKTCQALDNPA
jgi:hypothetical protein